MITYIQRIPTMLLTVTLFIVLLYGCVSNQPELDSFGALPAFDLTDQKGNQFSSNNINGKIVLANFIFTNCTEICPVLTPRFKEIQDRLIDHKDLYGNVILISISVDPESDTPDVLFDYSLRYGSEYNLWKFVTGETDQVRNLVNKGFMLSYQKINESFQHIHDDGSVHVHGYNVGHSNRVALVDMKGQIRAFYSGSEGQGETDWDVEKVMSDLRYLAK